MIIESFNALLYYCLVLNYDYKIMINVIIDVLMFLQL